MSGKVYGTLREAIHEAYNNCSDKQGLAWDLNWDKSEICNRTTQAEGYRPFPADDPLERIVKFMKLTGDFSYLFTLADKCGFDIPPIKRERLPELVQELKAEHRRLNEKMEQLVLSSPWVEAKKGGKR